MLDFFDVRSHGRMHPIIYRTCLGGFALARLWTDCSVCGPGRGRAFEQALYAFCDEEHLSLSERAGSVTFCGGSSASSLRHESDGVITAPDLTVHIETKHLSDDVQKNDLLIFNQKGLDFLLAGDLRVRHRPLYRLFITGSPLSREARRFCVLWGIIAIEPDVLPLPVLHWLAGSTFPAAFREARIADQIWRAVPIAVAPLQERVRRLVRCVDCAEETINGAQVEQALDNIQEEYGNRWWRNLDSIEPLWLEHTYARATGQRSHWAEFP